MSMPVIPVSVGELADKWTILKIKFVRIEDPDKTDNIAKELLMLEKILDPYHNNEHVAELIVSLLRINKQLWNIEDEIRVLDRKGTPDIALGFLEDGGELSIDEIVYVQRFIELARLVYITNDERSKIKRQINELTGSEIIEEKSYEEY